MRTFTSRLLLVSVFLAVVCSTFRPGTSAPAHATSPVPQSGPTILKASLIVRANRLVHYWKAPDVDNYWSWMPELSFTVLGPVNTGSAFVVDFTNEASAPWYSVECDTPSIDATRWETISTPTITTHVDKRTTLATGVFGFTIRLKNELSGTNEKIMSGKYKVTKFHIGNNLPAFKNQFEYVVDQDWNLPIGYLYFNLPADPKMPPLVVSMWFRGELDNTKLAAYLFYNGKQLASTKEQTGSAGSDSAIFANSHEGTRWERWKFIWNQVRGWNADTSGQNQPQLFFLAGNPGEYEVRVLRDGDLARSAKFTIGADGRLVDNGITEKNNLGGLAMILPVKILGTGDGQWDPNAWKTDAFYGNPLSGFVAP